MKKQLFLLWFLCLVSLQALAQAPVVVPVKSQNTRYQLEREVITRWGKFNPKWYFILFHNKYREGKDRRNMKQLLPIMAAARMSAAESEQEDKDLTQVRDQEMFKMADRSLNKSYHLLYESKLKSLNNGIALLNTQAIAAGVDFDMIMALKGEQDRINADVTITKDSYEDDAKKAERFRVAVADLAALRGYYLRIINVFKTSQNRPKE